MRLPKNALAALAGTVAAVWLTGCGGAGTPANQLADDDYHGMTQPEEDGSIGHVYFTVADGEVTEAKFFIEDADGSVHDENYGKQSSDPEFYRRAQHAVEAEKNYVQHFEEKGDQNEVEVVAGASLSHRMFLAAIQNAIDFHEM